jgi:hypothetical protein
MSLQPKSVKEDHMAFVPNYEHDIFISYAHVDDEKLPGTTKGWVTTLQDCLRVRLAQRLGRSDTYSLWMDYKLQGHEMITPQILNAIRKSATILIVLSPGYIASEWCNREKNTFLELIKEPRSRVFIIERDRIDNRPAEFNDLKGFQFWKIDREGKSPHILGTPELEKELTPDVRDYYAQVDDLTQELVDELHAMKTASGQLVRVKTKPGVFTGDSTHPIHLTIYLAQVTDDLDFERSNVKRYLDQAGFYVLPETSYSQESSNFRQAVERDLAKSSLFVQLLSGVPGKKPPDLPQGYVKLQLDLAKEVQKPILQWRSHSLDISTIEDEDHLRLVEGDTVRAEGIEDFKREIKKRLDEKPKPLKPVSAFVFVNMETSDRPLAEQVCAVLDHYGIDYILPMQSDNPSKNREDLEQNLLDCTGIIIIYGSSTIDWVRQTLRESRKILPKRESPLQAFAVFEGPPEQKCPLDFKIDKMQILDSRSRFDESTLKKFLEVLKKGGA